MFRTNQHDTPEPTTRATRNAVDRREFPSGHLAPTDRRVYP
jgi:hypothetical protein